MSKPRSLPDRLTEGESREQILQSVQRRLNRFASKHPGDMMDMLVQQVSVDFDDIGSFKEFLLSIGDALVDVVSAYPDDQTLRDFTREVYRAASSHEIDELEEPLGERMGRAFETVINEVQCERNEFARRLDTLGPAITITIEHRVVSDEFAEHYAEVLGVTLEK